MTSAATDLGALQEAINSGEDAVAEFVRTEVLYRAFEERNIEYHTNEHIQFEEKTVRPSRFEDNLQFLVQDVLGLGVGYKIRVGSQYMDRARVPDPERATPKPFGGASTTPVVVLFRCEARIDQYGVWIDDPNVIVIAYARIQD